MTLVLLEWAVLSTVVALFGSLGWWSCESRLRLTEELHNLALEREAFWKERIGDPRLCRTCVPGSRGEGKETPLCGLCGKSAEGFAMVDDVRLCHPDEGQDCYHLWTVYGKRPARAEGKEGGNV